LSPGLAKKVLPDGSECKYEWNGAGMLAKVVRPDGKTIEFGCDALGRRVWQKYGAKTTKWIWDGNVSVHEVSLRPSAGLLSRPRGWILAESRGHGEQCPVQS
jgi:YD repeat-containing protein